MDSPLNNLSISTASSNETFLRSASPPSLHASLLGLQWKLPPRALARYTGILFIWTSSVVSLVLKVSTFKPDVSLKQCFKTHDIKKYSQREILRKQISLKYSYNLFYVHLSHSNYCLYFNRKYHYILQYLNPSYDHKWTLILQI